MNKQSLYKTLYRSVLILFSTFIIFIILFNILLAYNKYTDAKNKIEKEILQTKKQTLKNEVDFFLSDLEATRKRQKDEIKKEIKKRVDIAYNITLNLYKKYQNNTDIQNIVKESLRELKFYDIGDQYVFMTKLDGKFILTPGLSHLEGKNVFELQIKSNKESIRQVIDMVKTHKKGYFTYTWENHHTKKFEKKTSYFRYFKPFDCYIGTGVFNSDIEKKVKENFIEKIENFRLGKEMSNYIFAGTYEGVSLTYPAKNKNMYHVSDVNGLKIVQELIKIAQNGNGYLRYILPVGTERTKEKISYVQGIPKWNLYIGIGETLEGIEHLVEEKKEELLSSLYEDVTITVIFGFIFLIIFYSIFNYVKSLFYDDMEKLLASIELLVNKNKEIDINSLKFDELSKISQHMNSILETKKAVETELKNKESILYHQTKMAAMGEMLENIAHQWRQPLSIITTSSSAVQIKQELNQLDKDYLNDSLEAINNNAEYLSSTIDDFRNYFLPNKQKQSFQLADAIDKSLNLLKSKLKNNHIIVDKNFSLIDVTNYKNELIQVILVLLNNAKDVLDKITNEKIILIHTHKDEKFGYIEIQDNGGGIKADIHQKIFEPYFTTKHRSQGTGIGLYMAREIIVKHMKRDISIKNKSFTYNNTNYTGAKFTIKLPL